MTPFTMIKVRAVTAVFIFFSASVSAEDVVNFPSDWGSIFYENIVDTNCPSLEGEYSEFGWVYEIENGKENYKDASINDSYRVISGSKFKKTDLNQDVYKNSFSIQQETASAFVLTRFDKNSWNTVVSAEVNKADDGLVCSNGWWVIPSEVKDFGVTEGYTFSMSITRRFTRLTSMDLIAHLRTVSERTDWFIFKKVTITDTFYRFKSEVNNK